MELSGTRMIIRKLRRRPKYRYMVANRLIPHLPWAILLLLSIYLFKQRVFADSGFYVSQFINNKFFWIECQRIVLAFSQVLPLIGVWAGFELRYVLLLYSVSHVLFFYVLFLIVYYGLRDRRSGLLIIISQTVGIMHSFFTPMFELYYGVPLLITFYAFWRLNIRSNTVLFFLLILEILILFSHPTAFILFTFLLLYDYQRSEARPLKWYIWLGVVFTGSILFKSFVMCDYEVGKFNWQFDFRHNTQYRQLFNPEYHKIILKFLIQYYWEVLGALILVILMLFRRKEFFRLILVLGFTGGYFFLVNAAYTLSPSRYMEQVMFPFVPLVFIPLVYGIKTSDKPGLRNISVLAITAIIAYRLFVIYSGSEVFRMRTSQMETLISTAQQKGISKVVVSADNIDKGFSMLNWSYPLETILLSSLNGTDRTVTIVPEDDYRFEGNNHKVKKDQFVFRRWEIKDYTWLNKNYFHLDKGVYKLLSDTVPNRDIDYLKRNISLRILSGSYLRANDTLWIPVKIMNRAATPLYTGGKNKVFVTYLWARDSDILNWNTIRTRVDSDVVRQMNQFIKVAVPPVTGRLTLKVDLLTSDNQWFGINSSREILIY